MAYETRRAPAKVNLRLAIRGVRADGYHLVETWLAPLPDLFDDVSEMLANLAHGIDVAVFGALAAEELQGPDNLAGRAATAWARAGGLRPERGLTPGDGPLRMRISIEKRIPLAAGLGGGSSDAAAVLRILEGGGRGIGAERLHAIAAELGADVPFFLQDRCARASGIGDVLVPAPPPAWRWAALGKPERGLRTADVYARFDADGGARPGGAGELYGNDLQGAAIALCPEIAQVLALLRGAGAGVAQVSGSGSASFGLFADEAGARAAADAIARDGFWSAVSRVGGGDE
jgi:4-diphosphocytidyl-2-C-methyl-D-erythritol kinase